MNSAKTRWYGEMKNFAGRPTPFISAEKPDVDASNVHKLKGGLDRLTLSELYDLFNNVIPRDQSTVVAK